VNDLWYALRALRKSPGFALAAILTLAVAIAADCVVFSVADAVLFRPLPYKDPDRLTHVFYGWKGHPPATYGPSIVNFLDWKRRNNVFEDMALTSQSAVSLKIGEYPESVTAIAATTNLFEVLGVKAALGRTFSPEEGYAGRAEQVAMLSYDFWQNRFHGDPDVLGKQLSLDDGPRRSIIGVLPAGFKFTYPKGVPIWTPLATDRAASRMATIGDRSLNLVTARLKPGMTPAQAEAGMRSVLTELAREYPRTNEGCTETQVASIRGWTTRQVRSLLFTLLGAVTFVLLIGCANVANLSLARMTDRERETTVRAALGAARWRLVREFLAESLLVALAAGALGLLLSGWGLDALRNLLPPGLPRGDEVRLDGRVAWFALAVTMATTVAFGLLPALKCSKINLVGGLTGAATGMGGRRGRGIRASLVIAETALALVLAAGAGLMMNSFIRLMRVDLGFNPQNVLAVQAELPQWRALNAMGAEDRSSKEDSESRKTRSAELWRVMTQTDERMLDAVRAIPGVRQACLATPAPLLGGEVDALTPGPKPGSSAIHSRATFVVGDCFGALQIPLLAGRVFTSEEARGWERLMVLNQSLARLLFPNGGAVGQYLPGSVRVIGVVADVRDRLLFPPEPEYYTPGEIALTQSHFIVRYAEAAKANLNGLIRQKLSEIDPDATVTIDSFEEVVSQQGAQTRFLALLFAGAGALGLLLASSGVFGVTAYGVNRRTRELGVRIAIGAAPGDVLRMIVREAVVMAFAGAALGTAAVFALQSVLRNLLFEVPPGDPLTLLAVIGVLAAVTIAASYVPARRVLKIDPATALRHE
jgi:predicted permease